MGNMGYCRFQNTLQDLRDCDEHWEDVESEEEKKAQARLLALCIKIARTCGPDEVSNALYRVSRGA